MCFDCLTDDLRPPDLSTPCWCTVQSSTQRTFNVFCVWVRLCPGPYEVEEDAVQMIIKTDTICLVKRTPGKEFETVAGSILEMTGVKMQLSTSYGPRLLLVCLLEVWRSLEDWDGEARCQAAGNGRGT